MSILFSSIIFVVTLVVIYINVELCYKKSKAVPEYMFYISILVIALLALTYMIHYSGEKSLWYDDMYQIKFSGGNQSLKEVLNNILTIDMQPPIFGVLAWLWLKIVPYGTMWVKLLSEIAVTLGIVILGLAGKLAYGKKVGVLCSLFATVYSTIYLDMAYSFRPYGFVFLFASLVLYTYILKISKPTYKTYILYGISVLFLAATYYIGAIICCILFIFDVIIIIKRKIKIYTLSTYFIPALFILPWVVASFNRVSNLVQNFWPEEPEITSINNAIKYLTSYNDYLYLLLIFSTIFIVISMLNRKVSFFAVVAMSIVYGIISIIFLYSKLRSSIWQNRYLLCTIPFLIFFTSYVLDKLFSYIKRKNKIKYYAIGVGTIFFLCAPQCIERVYGNVTSIFEPFAEAADILKEQDDIYSKTTLVYSSTVVGEGWNYYLTENYTLPEVNWCDNTNYKEYDILQYSTVYFFDVHVEVAAPDDLLEILQTNFTCEVLNEEYKLYKYVNNNPPINYITETDKFAHISLDDTINIFEDIYEKDYQSIFENSTLKLLQKLHSEYGVVFSLYLFYENEDFNLSMFSDKYAVEFQNNSDWLKFGFHGKNEKTSYKETDYAEAKSDYELITNEIYRITNSEECIDHVPRVSFFEGNMESIEAFRDSEHGLRGLLSADDDRVSYYLSEEVNDEVRKSEFYLDSNENITFFHTDVRIENQNQIKNLNSWIKSNTILIVFTHEWQLSNSEIVEDLTALCKAVNKNGYIFDYPENYI